MDPAFTYAYTLAGHEYLANEDFQRGLEAYRTALRLDPRHYNAWCAPTGCTVLKGFELAAGKVGFGAHSETHFNTAKFHRRSERA